MGLFDWIADLFTGSKFNSTDLAKRLGMTIEKIRAVNISYHSFTIPKANGYKRHITAPNPELKKLQRTILKRLLAKLSVHPNATGFRKGYSVVSNAKLHESSAIIINSYCLYWKHANKIGELPNVPH